MCRIFIFFQRKPQFYFIGNYFKIWLTFREWPFNTGGGWEHLRGLVYFWDQGRGYFFSYPEGVEYFSRIWQTFFINVIKRLFKKWIWVKKTWAQGGGFNYFLYTLEGGWFLLLTQRGIVIFFESLTKNSTLSPPPPNASIRWLLPYNK